MNVKILWVGKTKNSPIRSLTEDYLGRVRRMVSVEIVEIRDRAKARNLGKNERVAAEDAEILRRLTGQDRVIVLDESGNQLSSAEFAGWFGDEQNRGTKQVAFVIGGPEGTGRAVSGRADLKLSLGMMTWTHEMCRVLLLEQIYRACCILRNIPYHRQGCGGG